MEELSLRGRIYTEPDFNLTYEKTTTGITVPVAAPFMDC